MLRNKYPGANSKIYHRGGVISGRLLIFDDCRKDIEVPLRCQYCHLFSPSRYSFPWHRTYVTHSIINYITSKKSNKINVFFYVAHSASVWDSESLPLGIIIWTKPWPSWYRHRTYAFTRVHIALAQTRTRLANLLIPYKLKTQTAVSNI